MIQHQSCLERTEGDSFRRGWPKPRGSCKNRRQFFEAGMNTRNYRQTTRNGVPISSDGRYRLKGHWPTIMNTLLEFPEHTAPSVRDLAIKIGGGRIHWGTVHRWNSIPEALVARIRCGSRIQLKLTDLGLQIMKDPSCFGP